MIVASLLPVLALAAYFFLTPANASAQSCPGGTFNSSCFMGTGRPVGCESGSGICYPTGANGIFVFCGPHPGPGICDSGGVVCCTQ